MMLLLLPMGFWMVALPFSEFKLDVYFWHKSFGLLILFLVGLRLVSRIVKPIPDELPAHAAWERILSKTVRIVFYASMIGMPLSGWVMSSAGDFPVSFFGLFEMPTISEKNEQVFKVSKTVHEIFAFTLIGAIGLHIMGGLKHHLIDRDTTLTRMGGTPALAVLGLGLLSVPAYFAAMDIYEGMTRSEQHESGQDNKEHADEFSGSVREGQSERAQNEAVQIWIIDPANSSINFTFVQYGKEISGQFENWSGDIRFDRNALDRSHAKIMIDISSVQTGSEDRNQQARGQDWFAVDEYPQAVFESRSFSQIETNRFAVDGVLSLRGVEKQVSFPFSLELAKDGDGSRSMLMNADLDLERLAFGVGQNQWESTDAIGNEVKVSITVHADAL